MSEMVERVARAIYEMRSKPWSLLPRSHKEPYLADAAAVLKAMREPTEAMIGAGGQAVWEQEDATSRRKPRDADDWPKDNARAAWQAMIDEAMR